MINPDFIVTQSPAAVAVMPDGLSWHFAPEEFDRLSACFEAGHPVFRGKSRDGSEIVLKMRDVISIELYGHADIERANQRVVAELDALRPFIKEFD